MSKPDTIAVDRRFYCELLKQVAYAHERLNGRCSCPFCAQARHQERKAA